MHPGGIKTAIMRNSEAAEGRNLEQLTKTFDKRLASTSPEKAAQVILDGVRKNKARILIGYDAKILEVAIRVLGAGYQRIFPKVVVKLLSPPKR